MQAVAEELRAVGVDARIELGGSAEVQARRIAGDFDLTFTWYAFSGAEPGVSVTRFFRPSGDPGGPYAAARDFGGCAGPYAPWLAAVATAASETEGAPALAGLVAATVIDPPALFLFDRQPWQALHERFVLTSRAIPYEIDWADIALRTDAALPRDGLAAWLRAQ